MILSDWIAFFSLGISLGSLIFVVYKHYSSKPKIEIVIDKFVLNNDREFNLRFFAQNSGGSLTTITKISAHFDNGKKIESDLLELSFTDGVAGWCEKTLKSKSAILAKDGEGCVLIFEYIGGENIEKRSSVNYRR